ncbi:hypothetical protein GOV11_02950, partial [Candidatus Woesearchaeota archaeon]|nr:hypothetical protein [Candidatus Woesearchaeota archaeon]
QCNDGIDNDGDGLIDYPADPHCKSLNDNSEKKKWYAFWKKKYPMGKPGIVETPIASVPASDAITKEPPEQPIVISENDDSIIDDKGSLKVYMRASKGTDNIKFVPTDSQYANLNKSFDTSATKVGVLVEKPHFLAEGSVKFTNGRESLYDRYGFLGEGESVLGAAGEITYRPWGPFAASVGLQYINQTLYSQFGITRFNKHSQTAMMFDPCVGIGTAFHKPTYFLLQGCATMQSNHDVMPGYAGSDYEFTPNAKLKFRIGNNRFGLLGDLRYGPEDRTVWTNNDLYLARDSSFMNGSLLLDARIGKNWGIQAGGQFSNVDSTFELGPNLDPDLYKDFAGDGSHTTAEAVAGVYFKFK